jgi:hypothetical protein
MYWKDKFLKNLEDFFDNQHHSHTQPRDELGRFGTKGSVGQQDEPYENKNYHESRKKFENEIKDLEHERAYVLGEKGGVMVRQIGDSNSVGFSEREMEMMKDRVLIHNHPNGSLLSLEDVDMAYKANVREIRAVTSHVTYSLPRPEGGWESENLNRFKEKFHDTLNGFYKTYLPQVKEGIYDSATASIITQVSTWDTVSKDTKLKYKTEKTGE